MLSGDRCPVVTPRGRKYKHVGRILYRKLGSLRTDSLDGGGRICKNQTDDQRHNVSWFILTTFVEGFASCEEKEEAEDLQTVVRFDPRLQKT